MLVPMKNDHKKYYSLNLARAESFVAMQRERKKIAERSVCFVRPSMPANESKSITNVFFYFNRHNEINTFPMCFAHALKGLPFKAII